MESPRKASRVGTRYQQGKSTEIARLRAQREIVISATQQMGPNDIVVSSTLGNLKTEPTEQVKVEDGTSEIPSTAITRHQIIKEELVKEEIVVTEYVDIGDDILQDAQLEEVQSDTPSLPETSVETKVEVIAGDPNSGTIAETGSEESEESSFKCSQCLKYFRNKCNLEKHLKTHNAQRKSFTYDECDKTYMSNKSLLNHQMVVHDGIKRHKCHLCPKKFARKSHLQVHKRTHDGVHEYKCDPCSKEFRNRVSFIKHQFYTHSVVPKLMHRCDKCPKIFFDHKAFNDHKNIHTGTKPISCKLCHKKFSLSATLCSHMRDRHSNKKLKTFQCNICTKRITGRQHYKTHLNAHAEIRPYECDECHKSFFSRDVLRKHLKTHSNSKGFQCVFCNEGFTRKPTFDAHILKHIGEKPFICNICDAILQSSCSLLFHRKLHFSPNAYKCNSCGKFFMRKGALKQHDLRCHTDIKPFICVFCHKEHSVSGDYHAHILRHVKEKWFICTHCGKEYCSRFILRRHTRAQHKMERWSTARD